MQIILKVFLDVNTQQATGEMPLKLGYGKLEAGVQVEEVNPAVPTDNIILPVGDKKLSQTAFPGRKENYFG
jgi:hypothetical protein